jgi:hypothetical protein
MADVKVPLIIRGKIIEDYELEFGDRGGSGYSFATPDVGKHIRQLVSTDAASLRDLYSISLEEIYDYVDELGRRLDLDNSAHLQEAFEVSCRFSNLSRPVLEHIYRNCFGPFKKENLRDIVDEKIGSEYLESWVPRRLSDGSTVSVRAIGARGVHIIAGNIPTVACLTFLRSAITRSDTIVKLPSNDPLTAVAIAREAIDMAADHPVTKHFSVAYWKGGDEAIEQKIYQSRNIEKICAWGGYSSIRHIAKYLGPGIDLITLDPKSSTTLIGKEAFKDQSTMRSVAQRVAVDIGGWDQEACSNARVIYIETGRDVDGVSMANRFGKYVYDALQALPKAISGGAVHFSRALMAELQAILPLTDFYKIYSDHTDIAKTGAIIVSQLGEEVEFSKLLYGRVGNLVPVDDINEAIQYFTSATQTVGIYPDALRLSLRDAGSLSGGQRFIPVGYAVAGSLAGPQDGMEPERRMCKWISDYHCNPEANSEPWRAETATVCGEV